MKPHPGPRLAVFDCDGTLVDSQATILASIAAAFEAAGLALPRPEAARRVIGLPLADALAALVPAGIAAEAERLAAAYRDAFMALHKRPEFEEPLFPGVAAVLGALADAGYVLGIATGKSRRGLERTLGRHGLLARFATLQSADGGPGKPHPDMLERAMAATGVVPAACVMIGDTTFDMLMANAAGAKAVGVGWGYHPVAELTGAGAHRIVETVAELPEAVRGLLP